ncbi:MAG: hypothetical protein KAS15_07010 [Nanoarchaeota archaeon]|nr:hypothetical protein [Nanoarchaeota archaeon]
MEPEILRKGLEVHIIRGSEAGKTGIVVDWEGPIEDDPDWQIDVNTKNGMRYLGLDDIRLI